jgi:hypothetical protein
MDDVAFQELLSSVKEAGKIRRGEIKPSREFVYSNTDVEIDYTKDETQEDCSV